MPKQDLSSHPAKLPHTLLNQSWRDAAAGPCGKQSGATQDHELGWELAMSWLDGKAEAHAMVLVDKASQKFTVIADEQQDDWLACCARELQRRHALKRSIFRDFQGDFSACQDYVAKTDSLYSLICLGDRSGVSHCFGVARVNAGQFRMFDPNFGEFTGNNKYGVGSWLARARHFYVQDLELLRDRWSLVSFA